MSRDERLRDLFLKTVRRNSHLNRIPEADWLRLFEEKKVLPLEGTPGLLFRIKKDFRGFPEGTVFSEDITVFGFPHIPRIFVLIPGLKRYFNGTFFVEEKIEGYNVRIFSWRGEVLVVTRRGFVCPFASDRWVDFLPSLPEFFRDHPNLCVCAEVAGPENPFVTEWPPHVKSDVRFFVFDIMDLSTGRLLKPEEKYELIKRYSFTSPEVHGPFSAENEREIKDILLRYETEGREGVVVKASDGSFSVKYVTPVSNLEDIRVVFPFLGEVAPEYVTQRLVRYVLGCFDLFGEASYDISEVQRRILSATHQVLERVKRGEPVEERFRVRFRTEEAFQAMLAHFRHARVRVEVKKVEREDGYLKVEFSKLYHRATEFWRSKLQGFCVVD